MNNAHIEYLLRQYLEKQVTEAERTELFNWLEMPESTPVLNDWVDDFIVGMLTEEEMEPEKAQLIMESILGSSGKVKRVRPWKWMAAAAAVLMLVTAGWFLWHTPQRPGASLPATAQHQPPIGPATNKAILTLANGRQVLLDSAGRQQIVSGNVAAVQSGGSLAYQATTELQYHTLTTPKGGQFSIRLPDGTMVWLNAGSAIVYPTVFNGKERVVEVSGEVYMEVAKDAAKPFRVRITGGQELDVLGTAFNINAYADEPVKRTTLVSGSVQYHAASGAYVLKPGQQAVLTQDKVVLANASIADAVAWKNGFFYFNNASLQEVMRQLSRWYDVEVAYEGNMSARTFEGKIERSLSLQDVLEVLARNKVHYTIEGKKIMLLP